MDSHGSLTVKYKKNCYRPHKSCIFLSNFIHIYIVSVVFMCYNRYEVMFT